MQINPFVNQWDKEHEKASEDQPNKLHEGNEMNGEEEAASQHVQDKKEIQQQAEQGEDMQNELQKQPSFNSSEQKYHSEEENHSGGSGVEVNSNADEENTNQKDSSSGIHSAQHQLPKGVEQQIDKVDSQIEKGGEQLHSQHQEVDFDRPAQLQIQQPAHTSKNDTQEFEPQQQILEKKEQLKEVALEEKSDIPEDRFLYQRQTKEQQGADRQESEQKASEPEHQSALQYESKLQQEKSIGSEQQYFNGRAEQQKEDTSQHHHLSQSKHIYQTEEVHRRQVIQAADPKLIVSQVTYVERAEVKPSIIILPPIIYEVNKLSNLGEVNKKPSLVAHTHNVEQQNHINQARMSSTTEKKTVEYEHHLTTEKVVLPADQHRQVINVPIPIVSSQQTSRQSTSKVVPSAIVAPIAVVATSKVVPTAIVAISVEEAIQTVPLQPPPPQQQFQILIPVPLFLTSTELHNMISSAYYERKEINMRYFTRFVHNRNHYFLKHSEVLDDITEKILNRAKCTSEYLSEAAAYFEETVKAYRTFHQEFAKIGDLSYLVRAGDLHTKNKYKWSSEATDGMKQLLLAQNGLTSRMRGQQYYLVTTILQTLAKTAKTYEQKCKIDGKHSMEFKNKFCDFEEKIIKAIKEIHSKVNKENKLRMKNQQRQKNGYDLLELELSLLESIQKSRILLEDWGKAQLQWWNKTIENEKATADIFKEVIKGYLISLRDLHQLHSPVKNCLEYWESANIIADIDMQWMPKYLLSLMSVDFIRNSLEIMDEVRVQELTLPLVDTWTQMNNLQKATGQREVLMDSLTIKNFECELYTGKRWVPALLVATIDENIIVLTEFYERKYNQMRNINLQVNQDASHYAQEQKGPKHYHVVRRVKTKNLLNTRKDELTVNLNEKVTGLIFDSWVKELIRFKIPDSAEEFMYFTENKTEVKKQYIV